MGDNTIADLENAEDLRFQQKELHVQRIAWRIIVLTLLLALTGVLGGNGPLSGASASAGDSLRVAYQRFTHVQEQTSIDITVRPPSADADEVKIALYADYLNSMDVQRITPDPDTETTADGRVIYTFPIEQSDQPITVTIDLMPDAFGLITGQVGLEGGPSVSLTHVVYP